MNVVLASDHRGYHLKANLRKLLDEMKIESLDLGTFSPDPVDYPDFAIPAVEKVSQQEYDRGILICGSGIGMSIVANKFPRIRAALGNDTYSAEMSRKHNDSNILCLGADLLSEELAQKIVKIWLTTEFEGGRHSRRIEKIREIEALLKTTSDADSG